MSTIFIFAELIFLLIIVAVVVWAIKPFKKPEAEKSDDKE